VTKRRGTVWLVDDTRESRREARARLKWLGVRTVNISTQDEFLDHLSGITQATDAPCLVVLDLRLPWADRSQLDANTIAGGVGCLSLLRQEPFTAGVPTIVFSAFIKDALIADQLQQFDNVTLVDKVEPNRLRVAAANLLPDTMTGVLPRLATTLIRWKEELIRWAKLITACTVVVGALVWVVHLIIKSRILK
jgi:CheY-like chemotaxis protein